MPGSRGIAYVTHPATGIFCIGFDPALNLNIYFGDFVMVSVSSREGGTAPLAWSDELAFGEPLCEFGEAAVRTKDFDSITQMFEQKDHSFVILVP